MGSTALGDIPSGGVDGKIFSHASAATDAGASAVMNIGQNVWRAPQNIVITDAWWEPTEADSTAAAAGSYRRYDLVDGSTDGLGTRVLASLTYSASQASNTTRALTLIAAPTVTKGNVVFGSYGATVGGTHAGTKVFAGHFGFNFRPV